MSIFPPPVAQSPGLSNECIHHGFLYENLEPTFERLTEMIRDHVLRASILFYFEVGEVIHDGYAEAVDDSFDRIDTFIELVEKALGPSFRRKLTPCLRLYRLFDREELEQLFEGTCLTFTHYLIVSGLDKDQQLNLLQRAAENDWTVRDLAREIEDGIGRRREPGGGRPLARPRSARAGLRQLTAAAAKFLRQNHEVWFSEEETAILAAVDDILDSSNYTDELRDRLVEAADQLAEIGRVAAANGALLREAAQETNRRLELQARMDAERDRPEAERAAATEEDDEEVQE